MATAVTPHAGGDGHAQRGKLAITVIEPASGWIGIDFRELWAYRELFGFMVWRDVIVRYKQTLLGIAWAVLVPLIQMVVFTLIFGKVAGLPSDALPSSVFYMANLVIWRLFQQTVQQSGGSLVNSANLLTKIYFPRLIIPAASMLKAVVDFGVAFGVLLVVMVINRGETGWEPVWPAATTLLLPLPIALALATALGIGLVFAALNVRYRDINEIMPFLLQIWMYATVIIPYSAIRDHFPQWRYLYALNPVGSALECFRWCLASDRMAGSGFEAWVLMALSLPLAVGTLLFGAFYFRRLERMFADII